MSSYAEPIGEIYVNEARRLCPIPGFVVGLVSIEDVEAEQVFCQYGKGHHPAYGQTSAYASYGGYNGSSLMDRTGIGIEIVGRRANEEQSCATYEGEALNALARVEHTHHHGNGDNEHDEGEEKSVVAPRLTAYHFAARAVLQLIVNVAYHVGCSKAHKRQQQKSCKQEEGNNT